MEALDPETTTRLARLGELLLEYVTRPETLYQALIVAAAFAAAQLLSWQTTPKLEAWAHEITTTRGSLRVIVALLRRLHWLFFVLVLGLAVVLMRAFEWPAGTRLASNALVLAGAWLAISVLSLVIRNRAAGRLIAVGGWTYVAAVILGITDDAAALLDGAAFSVGDFRLSLLLLLKTVILFSGALWLAVGMGNLFDHRIQRSEELTPSLQVLLSKVVKTLLLVLAAVVALSGLGIDLTVFTIFSGAVGVGIGFGLQKVVANFISGIIILLDRSIKPGDTISLGDTFGWIRELRARFVSVITRDGREYLIPNEDFITKEVINWSFSNELVRLDVPFGVSYDEDPHRVSELAIEAAAKVPRVVDGRRPVCWLTEFGDSSLDFLLRFWIRDPQNGLTNIRGQVLLSVWDAFKEHDVKIPYPRRQIIFQTPLDVNVKPER